MTHTNRCKAILQDLDREAQEKREMARNNESADRFAAAFTIAIENGLRLNIRCQGYELVDDGNGIIIVAFPGKQRIHAFQHTTRARVDGFKLPSEWTILDLVEAYVEAMK